MTETELRQALENIAETNLLLKLENDIFERYLARRDPENLQSNFLNSSIFFKIVLEIDVSNSIFLICFI